MIQLIKGWPGKPLHPQFAAASIDAYTFGVALLVLGALGVGGRMAHGSLLALAAGLTLALAAVVTGLLDLPRATPARTSATVDLLTTLTAGVLFAAVFVGQLDGDVGTVALMSGLAAEALLVARKLTRPRPVAYTSAVLGDDATMLSGASPELEVERSVRDRLYGRGSELRATPAPRAALTAGHLFGGRYRLLERVGRGGMAVVYRAWDERLKRDVAVKVIADRLARDPLSVFRFRQETERCARLAHLNIVTILDAGDEPREYSVMEFVLGLDAGALLERRGRLTPEQTVHVLAQVSDALAYAHEQDVLHHDVSPRNILIGLPDGTAKLADFGLGSSARDVLTGRVADVTATPGYVAPEILRGSRPSSRSDLYSLGVVAYRLLTGSSRARPGDPDATAPMATAAPRLQPLGKARPGLPRGLTEAVQQAVAHDPDARQDSVAEFRAQLVDGRYARLRLQHDEAFLPEAGQLQLPNAA